MPAVRDVVMKIINRVILFKILECVYIGVPDPFYLEAERKYQCGFLDRRALKDSSGDESYELPAAFLKQAYEKGDECFGIAEGDILASYGWYSTKPTVVVNDLRLRFNDEYVYMYKGFTHPRYRGQHLHAIGMTMALQEYLRRGFKGLVSYVESNNASSLKSVYRMGYHAFGRIYVTKILGAYLVYHTRGCQGYGVCLETGKGRGAREP